MPSWYKSDVKSVMGRKKGPNYKSQVCEIISVPGQWDMAIRSISSICQLGSFNELVIQRKGGTSKYQLQPSRLKLCFSLFCPPCAIISNMTRRSEWATGIQFSRRSQTVLQIKNQLAILKKLYALAGGLPGCAEEVPGVDFPNWVTSVSHRVVFKKLGENFQETSLTGTHKNSKGILKLLNF